MTGFARRRPAWRLVLSHPAHFIAFGGGIGLAPIAPGTFGTLLGILLFWIFGRKLAPPEFALVWTAMFVAGIWACGAAGRAVIPDHGGIVWDEIVAIFLVLFFVPPTPGWHTGAFLLFRLFDILKPPPIRYFDRSLKGGFGVMFDDLLAAFYALLVLAAWKALAG